MPDQPRADDAVTPDEESEVEVEVEGFSLNLGSINIMPAIKPGPTGPGGPKPGPGSTGGPGTPSAPSGPVHETPHT